MLEFHKFPSPEELRNKLPLSEAAQAFISNTRRDVARILDGEDSRLLLIVGPCSIHDLQAAKEYATRLSELLNEVSDQFLVLMRAYIEKPRTTLGWKGYVYDPDLNGGHDMEKGLTQTRRFFLDLAELSLPVATEFLDIPTTYYLSDCVSWGCIGARTTTSQVHRQIASSLSLPIAFKNNTDGNVKVAIDGIMSAANPHSFVGINPRGETALLKSKGNPHGHIILRGGKEGPNFNPEALANTLELLRQADLPARLLIDCSHDNADRLHEKQIKVFNAVINQVTEGNSAIRGLLLESNLRAGKQQHIIGGEPLKYGVSITDPCLDWETTEQLIKWGYNQCKCQTGKELMGNLG